MQFRPCIDIHNGNVVQIVGETINDNNNSADSNFISDRDSAYYAKLYKDLSLPGGHVIILNGDSSQYYEKSRREAIKALQAYQNGLQIGGSVNADNAGDYIAAGASHVIVTSYVFKGGSISFDNLLRLNNAVGRDRIVLDLSCKLQDDRYFIATDRWQVLTNIELNPDTLCKLARYCDEFLVHAVDSEGKRSGIDRRLLDILKLSPIPVTYAGGIADYDDILSLRTIGGGKINFTIGTALDIFGGNLKLSEVIKCTR